MHSRTAARVCSIRAGSAGPASRAAIPLVSNSRSIKPHRTRLADRTLFSHLSLRPIALASILSLKREPASSCRYAIRFPSIWAKPIRPMPTSAKMQISMMLFGVSVLSIMQRADRICQENSCEILDIFNNGPLESQGGPRQPTWRCQEQGCETAVQPSCAPLIFKTVSLHEEIQGGARGEKAAERPAEPRRTRFHRKPPRQNEETGVLAKRRSRAIGSEL